MFNPGFYVIRDMSNIINPTNYFHKSCAKMKVHPEMTPSQITSMSLSKQIVINIYRYLHKLLI